jgi:hypothetical protein
LVLSAVAGIVLWGATAAQAAPQNGLTPTETLQDLINLNPTGGVRIGNIIFSDFSYTGNTGTNPAPTASNISVANSPYTGTGLEFVSSWSGFTGGNQDSLVSYAVQAAPGFTLNFVQLDFNGSARAFTGGTGQEALVNETVSTLNVDGSGNPIGGGSVIQQMSVFNTVSQVSNPNNPPITLLETSMNLSPTRTGIFITKDIQANGGTNGTASISYVVNTYQVSPVPEPMSFGLLGTIGCGLLVRRRRA